MARSSSACASVARPARASSSPRAASRRWSPGGAGRPRRAGAGGTARSREPGRPATAFADKAGELLASDTPVAAICGATGGLAAAGLLDDRRHTSNAPEYLAATGYGGGHLYVDEPAVTDGALVTATATAPVEFARAVLALPEVYEPSVLASWHKLYGQRDPAGYFELLAAGT